MSKGGDETKIYHSFSKDVKEQLSGRHGTVYKEALMEEEKIPKGDEDDDDDGFYDANQEENDENLQA